MNAKLAARWTQLMGDDGTLPCQADELNELGSLVPESMHQDTTSDLVVVEKYFGELRYVKHLAEHTC